MLLADLGVTNQPMARPHVSKSDNPYSEIDATRGYLQVVR